MDDRSESVLAFRQIFGVDPRCCDRFAIADGLRRLPAAEPARIKLVGDVADWITQDENQISASSMCTALFEAHFGHDILEGGFFSEASVWPFNDQNSHSLSGCLALSKVIIHWARRVLAFPEGLRDEDVDKSIRGILNVTNVTTRNRCELIEEARRSIAVIVVDRFCRLLLRRSLLKNDKDAPKFFDQTKAFKSDFQCFHFSAAELSYGIEIWRRGGSPVADLNGWMHYLCTSLKRFGWDGMEPLTRVAYATVEMLWPTFWPVYSFHHPHRYLMPALEETIKLSDITTPLNWWLHGVSHEPSDPLIPYVVNAAWKIWEECRSKLSPSSASNLDYEAIYATARYGTEALAGYLEYLQDNFLPNNAVASQALLDCLERYSSRIAFKHLFLPSENRVSPTPESHVFQTESTAALRSVPSYNPKQPARINDSPLISEKTFGRLTLTHNCGNHLPQNTAILGLHDLPRCWDSPKPGQRVVTFEVMSGGRHVVCTPVISTEGERVVNAAGELLERFDHAVSTRFDEYSARLSELTDKKSDNSYELDQKLALFQLASQLSLALEDRYRKINYRYGELIDIAIQAAIDQGVSASALCKCNLVVIPRGMTATSPIDLLGKSEPLFRRFRSITTAPSRNAFNLLYERAKEGNSKKRTTVGVVGFEADVPSVAPQLRGQMVRHIMRQSEMKLGAVDSIELLLASEQPLASLAKAHAMMDEVDCLMLFGHGTPCVTKSSDQAPFGIQLADGAFPNWDYESDIETTTRGTPNIVLACSCYGGRLVQDKVQSDSFSPYIEELLMSIAFADRPNRLRLPSLVGGFVHQIPGAWAADFLIEMLSDQFGKNGMDVANREPGFNFAKQRIYQISRLMEQIVEFSGAECNSFEFSKMVPESKESDVAFKFAEVFLKLFSLLSFQFCGVEPARRPLN